MSNNQPNNCEAATQTTQHTPGRWYACKSDGNKICIRQPLDCGFRRIAHLNAGTAAGYVPEDYANAQLIAAAPELLEALEDALTQTAKLDFSLSANWNGSIKTNIALILENAIAKAKGMKGGA